MQSRNCHERVIAAPPGRIAALIADFDRIWPTQITPAPRPHGHRLYDAGPMLWEEFDRPDAARAFRVVRPDGLQGEHWFDMGLLQARPSCATHWPGNPGHLRRSWGGYAG